MCVDGRVNATASWLGNFPPSTAPAAVDTSKTAPMTATATTKRCRPSRLRARIFPPLWHRPLNGCLAPVRALRRRDHGSGARLHPARLTGDLAKYDMTVVEDHIRRARRGTRENNRFTRVGRIR